MTGTSIPRLRRVRFKDGRTIEVLRPKPSDDQHIRAQLKKVVAWAMEMDRPLGGAAIAVWDIDGSSICDLQSNGTIPAILVPDFVRNRLLAAKIEDWTIDTLNGR